MAHLNVRTRQTKHGLKWIVTEAQWQPGQDKVKEKVLTEIVLADLGFTANMTPVQAKEHAKKLNSLGQVKRKEQRAKVQASERLSDLALVEKSIIPAQMSALFVSYMEENWYGGKYNLRKQIQHWAKVQKIITKLNVQPHEYFKRKNEFYNHFKSQGMSKSYVEKILKVLNLWGEFYAEQTKTFFKKVPGPKGIVLENLKDASKATGQGAHPLTVALLNQLSNKLPVGQWEYIHACLWLGLRPSELNNIISDQQKYFQVTAQGQTQIAGVYQSKLVSVSKEKRWKWVPCFHSEQVKALQNIQNRIVNKPLVKTLKAYSGVDSIGLYSGRKGFTDLMLSLGQSLEDISQWLGHASIERTWKHYKNKNLVKFNPISEAQATKEKQAK